jgi:hypothetical protein
LQPPPCVPPKIHRIDALPLAPHGKIDRRELVALLVADAA